MKQNETTTFAIGFISRSQLPTTFIVYLSKKTNYNKPDLDLREYYSKGKYIFFLDILDTILLSKRSLFFYILFFVCNLCLFVIFF